MYLDNGNFYCQTTFTYYYISAYGLGNSTSRYICSNFDALKKEDRSVVFKPIDFTVYPNPRIGELMVQLPSTSTDGYQLYLHDMLGRTIHQELTTSFATSVTINMTDYKNGVYYMEVRAAGVRGIQK